jgi:hypothetical protein
VKGSAAIDAALTGRATGRPAQQRQLTSRPQAFALEWRVDGIWDASGYPVDTLESSGFYRLQISVRAALDSSGWQRTTLVGETCYALITGGENLGLSHLAVDMNWEPVDDYNAIEVKPDWLKREVPLRFGIQVASDCTASRAPFCLRLCWLEALDGPQQCFELQPIAVRGQTPQRAVGGDAAVLAALDAAPIPGVAWLYVTSETDKLKLRLDPGTAVPAASAGLALFEPLDLVLPVPGDGFAGVRSPDHARGLFSRVRQLSQDYLGRMSEWLKDLGVGLRRRSLPSLMIIDQTDVEFPWELTEIEPNCFLGAEMTVARWVKIGTYGSRHLPVERQDLTATGKVLHLLDDTLAQSNGPERNQLDKCLSYPVASSDVLGKSLRQPEQFGLIYLACHGAFLNVQMQSAAPHKALWSEGQTHSIHYVDLALLQPVLPDDERLHRLPVVIINACHSGRLAWTPVGLGGMPRLFLSTVARALIGTLGQVEETEASRMGAAILARALQETDGVVLADLLRDLRAAAAKDFRADAATDKQWQRFANTFMYVYYGDPRIRLDLCAGHNVASAA